MPNNDREREVALQQARREGYMARAREYATTTEWEDEGERESVAADAAEAFPLPAVFIDGDGHTFEIVDGELEHRDEAGTLLTSGDAVIIYAVDRHEIDKLFAAAKKEG